MQMKAKEHRLLIAELLGVFKMNTLDNMSRFKVHSIVECIKQYDFCFEIPEVEDSLEDILSYFGIHTSLTEEERRLIKDPNGECGIYLLENKSVAD